MITKVSPSSPRAASIAGAKRRTYASTLLLSTAVLIALILVCFGWTLWLMAITLFPNETANDIMGTSTLDGGTFWHFCDMPVIVGSFGVAGLGITALGYLYVLWIPCRRLRALCWHSAKTENSSRRSSKATKSGPQLLKSALPAALPQPPGLRQHTNAIIKVGDLVLHIVILVQLLEAGLPTVLVVAFAAIAAVHALLFAVIVATANNHLKRLHLVLDTIFDFLVAIGFPVLVLAHSASFFTFDMPLMAVSMRVFPPGFFERYAAMIADPVEVVAVRQSLSSLQINSPLSVFTRVGTMLMLARRLWQLAQVVEGMGLGRPRDLRIYYGQQRALGILFVLVAVGIVVLTEGSVRTAGLACQPHKECAQHAHRWILNLHDDDLTRCPCLALVDRNTMVATHDEWVHPPDRTLKVTQLAHAGMLRTLQLVNRGLEVLPDELRRCKHLRHISLYFTHTKTLPDWFSEFTKLEFLHIEGKYPRNSLLDVPENMLENMQALTFLHFALHTLDRLPSLDRVTSLKSLNLVGLPHVLTLPRLTSLRNLEQLTVTSVARVQLFPDLSNLHQLTSLNVLDRGSFCCNGFLDPSKCNLAHSMCQYQLWADAPAVDRCVTQDEAATPQTRAMFQRFNTTACYGEALPPGVVKTDPAAADVIQCNGTLYRECHRVGSPFPAMCYNTRWMVIACDDHPFAIEMRRQQIKLGLGAPCNPEYEAWLGCGNSTA